MAHLEGVLASNSFASSRRCQEFLKYVVMETLEGRADRLKERTIAVSVFGKGDSYDPSEQSIVRVKAVEVRKRLARYYDAATPEGVRIELPPGTYVPSFTLEPPVETPPVARTPIPRRNWLILATALIIAAASAGAAFWPSAGDPVEQIWGPVLAQNRSVLIGLPSPPVYQYEAALDPLASDTVPSRHIRLMQDYYTGRGAAVGAARIAGLLGAHSRAFEIKLGQDVSFADLKRQPAVLLGAYSSFWTRELGGSLPLQLVRDDNVNGFRDAKNPSKKWLRPTFRHSVELRDDYAMIARVLDSSTGQILMLAAGLTAPGTQAAAEFLTSPERLQSLGDVPSHRNFQAILHAEVHGGTPGPARMVELRVW